LFFFSRLKASSNNSSGEAKRANRARRTSQEGAVNDDGDGKRTNRKKCRRKSMVWTKKGGSLKKIELLSWMLMLSEEKEDMGIGEFGAGVLGSGGYKNPAFAGATQREPG
jgi:hypothetical protein